MAQVAAVAVVFSFSADAFSCGASAGSGGVVVCNVKEQQENERKKWHVGGGYGFTSTKIVFKGEGDEWTVDQTRHVALASLEWRVLPRFNVQVGAGALVGGGFEVPGAALSFEPGFVGALGVSGLLVKNRGPVPFVLGTAQISGVFAETQDSVRYQAADLRLGASVGWTFFRMLSPYVVGRIFGGPISFELEGAKVTGTDLYHYQVGAGLSALLAERLDLYAEGIPLGERGISAGIGVSF